MTHVSATALTFFRQKLSKGGLRALTYKDRLHNLRPTNLQQICLCGQSSSKKQAFAHDQYTIGFVDGLVYPSTPAMRCLQELLEIPKPDAPAKMNILVFADMLGYSKNLLANAPEGRISMKKVVENYHSLTQEDVKRLVTEPKKGWDLVIFAVGCDPPRSNSIEDIIEQNTVISRLSLACKTTLLSILPGQD